MIDARNWYHATALALVQGRGGLNGFGPRKRRRRFARSSAAGSTLRSPGSSSSGGNAAGGGSIPPYSGPIDTDPSGEGAPVDPSGGNGGGSPFWAPAGDKVQLSETGPWGASDPLAPASLTSPIPPSVASAAIASMALDGYRRSRRGR